MSFDKSFQTNGAPPPASYKQQITPLNTAFGGGFAGAPQPIAAPPVRPINPFDFSQFGGFPQGFFTPQVINPATFISQSTAVSITLTAASPAYQKITPTAYDCAWNLPDATTMVSGSLFILENAGLYPMPILSVGVILLGWVMPGQTVTVRMPQATSPNGYWKVMTGEKDRDAGLNWWGSPITEQTVAAASLHVCCQLSSQFGIHGFFDGSNYILWGHQIAEGRTSTSTSSVTVAAVTLASINCIDIVALSATEALIIYTGTGGLDTFVRTVDINTTTLALTLNTAVSIDTTPTTPGAMSCAAISSSLGIVTYGTSTNLKTRTISVSAGVCTANTAGTVAAVSCNKASIVVLSATLAHVQYNDVTNTLAKVCRIVLAGTAVTPGTPVTITSRNVSQGSSESVFQIGRANATSSWSISTDSNAVIYGEVFNDTGSIITITETYLLIGPTNNGGNAQLESPTCTMMNDYNGTCLVEFHSNGSLSTFRKFTVSGTAVVATSVLAQSIDIAAAPARSTTIQQVVQVFAKCKPYNGLGLWLTSKAATPIMFYKPFAMN